MFSGSQLIQGEGMTVTVGANLTLKMARTLVFPAASRYQSELAATCANLKLVGSEFDTDTLDRVTRLVKSLQDSIASLEELIEDDAPPTVDGKARYFCEIVLPAMAAVRTHADELEGLVADDLWPLPTYQEMLFIK